MHEVEDLKGRGFALGGGLDNAVVLDEQGVLNSEGLRFADEFIRHKLLDAIGDLYARRTASALVAHKSGHALNNRLRARRSPIRPRSRPWCSSAQRKPRRERTPQRAADLGVRRPRIAVVAIAITPRCRRARLGADRRPALARFAWPSSSTRFSPWLRFLFCSRARPFWLTPRRSRRSAALRARGTAHRSVQVTQALEGRCRETGSFCGAASSLCDDFLNPHGN